MSARLIAVSMILFAVSGSAGVDDGQESQNRDNQGRDLSAAEVHVLPVQGNLYMLVGAGGNITLQVGSDGVLLVDTGLAPMSEKVIAAVRSVSNKPIRYIINTHIHSDHTGGNEAIAKLGRTIAGGNVVNNIGESAREGATVIAYQTVLDRMSLPNSKDLRPVGAWATDTYTLPDKKLYFNGETIEVMNQPAAHTDGDSMIFFRRSDVVSAGDIFTTTNYPVIDLQRGGNIQGIIAGLNRLIYRITNPAEKEEGGTIVIPGHGRLCDQADVIVYQEMVIIIRDRIQDMMNRGMTLDQIKQAKPTRDYDPVYGTNTGFWTTDMFVEAVYHSLAPK